MDMTRFIIWIIYQRHYIGYQCNISKSNPDQVVTGFQVCISYCVTLVLGSSSAASHIYVPFERDHEILTYVVRHSCLGH